MRFTIRDLLKVMFFCGLFTGAIVPICRYMQAPLLAVVAVVELATCAAAGLLMAKEKGAFIGIAIGFVIGLVTLGIVYLSAILG